jgi:hypothetical protein
MDHGNLHGLLPESPKKPEPPNHEKATVDLRSHHCLPPEPPEQPKPPTPPKNEKRVVMPKKKQAFTRTIC